MSYGYNSYNQYWFTLDRKHGFGIQYVEYAGKEEICHAFYEDGTFSMLSMRARKKSAIPSMRTALLCPLLRRKRTA